MKLVSQNIEKDQTGSVALIAEDIEDVWHVFNLIHKGDKVKTSTVRKVHSESATGSITTDKVKMTLVLQVSDTSFDGEIGELRVSGRNVEESKFVKVGQYHTFVIELHKKFTLYKQVWDSVTLDRVKYACDAKNRAEIAALVMQEGLAHLCLVTDSMTILKARIEQTIPKKRNYNAGQSDKAMQKFFADILTSFQKHVGLNIVKAVVIASPGFLKESFRDYLINDAVRRDDKQLLAAKSKIVLAQASSGHMQALRELMHDPSVQSQLKDTKAAEHVQMLDRFQRLLNHDPDRAYYGYDHCKAAVEKNAVEILMVSDELFRSMSITTRQKYIDLVDEAKDNGAEIAIFSSLHQTGKELSLLSGVAAILRFPLPEIEEMDVEDSDDSES
eukprot:Clim_evm71s11 gene=Clim_evmTU71s11